MEIQYRKIDDLIPYERNAKLHPESQIAKIARSIQEFGFRNPVLVDSQNEIIAGHGRVLAAKKVGIEQVPTISASDLTPEQVRALRLADNRIAEDAAWDWDLAKVEIEEIQECGVDIGLLGFDEEEINELNNEKTLLDIYDEDGSGHTSRQEPLNALIISIGSFVHYADRETIDFDTFRELSEKAQKKNNDEKIEVATKIATYALGLFE